MDKVASAFGWRRTPRDARTRRVVALASGGGHWIQMLRMRAAFDGCEVHYASTRAACRRDVAPAPFHLIPDASRWDKWAAIKSAVRISWLLVRVRPDVVLSTGALPGYLALRVGKLIGARTIWVDSIANAEELSMSGRHAGKVADLWLTQWRDLAVPGGPSYAGSVFS